MSEPIKSTSRGDSKHFSWDDFGLRDNFPQFATPEKPFVGKKEQKLSTI